MDPKAFQAPLGNWSRWHELPVMFSFGGRFSTDLNPPRSVLPKSEHRLFKWSPKGKPWLSDSFFRCELSFSSGKRSFLLTVSWLKSVTTKTQSRFTAWEPNVWVCFSGSQFCWMGKSFTKWWHVVSKTRPWFSTSTWRIFQPKFSSQKFSRLWLQVFLCSPLFGEMIHSD